ncbi:MAG: DUF4838 domain-containing protein [Candidatus Hydrogenedentes bacterium]|nr:DUF4838 domain-containing protein [Candidatus Hydrogenedentota bacterium]
MMRPVAVGIAALLSVLCVTKVMAQDSFVPLVRDGKPAVYLQLDKTPDTRNRECSEDMVSILERISGVRIPSEPVEGLVPLYIGEGSEFDENAHDGSAMSEEEFHLKVTPEAIFLLGGSSLGTQHAVYTMLRDLGCRWVMPGEIGECLPRASTLVLPVQDRVERPDFRFRDIWYAYGCSPEAGRRHAEWLRRNRMYRPPIMHGHNLTNTLSVLAPFEERPELYSLVEGKRQKMQICTSNPETVALVTKAIAQYMDKNPLTQAYSLCPDDNSTFCECDACVALDSGHMDSGGRPSIADRYQVFLNQVAEGLKATHPNALLTTYSYNENHTDPPIKTPVNPNTCIFATSSVYCSAHGIGDEGCASRQAFKKLLSSWTALTPHVFIYEYDPVPYSGGLPWPMWESHAREMKVYKDIGVKGVSFEGQDSWAAYFPNYYIAAQFMWDTSQDGDALFADLMKSFFQEAAPEMMDYYSAMASAFHNVPGKVEWGLMSYPKYFSPELVEACRTALARAEKLATTPAVKQRLEMVRLSFEQMDAYLALRRADDTVTYESYQANVARLMGSIDRMAAINEDYLLANIAKEKTGAGLSERFAKEQGFITQWQLCGPFDNAGTEGHDRVYPPEETIDLSASYSGKDGQPAVWSLSHTPEWRGYVDLLEEYSSTEWVCAYAACWVTLDNGPKDVMLRVGSNDSVKVFLNGGEVWNNKAGRVAGVDNDLVPVLLPEGTSCILLKIGQTRAGWGFFFRITEPDSDKVPRGLRVERMPPASPR